MSTGSPDIRRLADQLRRGNLLLLGRQLKEGRPLSASQMEMVQDSLDTEGEEDDGPKWATSQIALAAILNVHRRTVRRWMHEPGCPGSTPDGRYSVAEWRSWAADAGKAGFDEVELGEATRRNWMLRNQRLERQIAIEERATVPMAEVERVATEFIAGQRKLFGQIHEWAAELEYKTATELNALLQAKSLQLIDQTHELARAVDTGAVPAE